MATTVPYDPSLVLGNLIHEKDIKQLQAVQQAEEPVDVAQNILNDSIQTKHKLDMTLQEMVEMNVPASDLADFKKSIDQVGSKIAKNASAYGKAVLKAEDDKAAFVGNIKITEMPESPIDWNKSALKTLDLSSDTMIADAQFFKNDQNQQGSEAHANAVAASASTIISSIWGGKFGASTAGSVKNTVLNQSQQHSIAGTLVITATCTHKQADLFAPFIMDPEKAVYAWNWMFPSDQIQTTRPETLVAAIKNISASGSDDQKKFLSLLSGKTVGSSFVGMVHVLNSETSHSNQSSHATSLQAASQFEWGGFFASGKGQFGVDKDFSNNVKNLLSTADLTSHCSLITMGAIPTIKASDIAQSIKMMKDSPEEVMSQLQTIQGATDSDMKTMGSEASKSKIGQQFMSLNSNYIKSAVSAVSEHQDSSNKIIDVNTLMTAFDDYVTKAESGDLSGVPINYYVRHIDKPMIAKAWLKKFSPQDNWQLSSGDDDSKGEGQNTKEDGTSSN